MSHIQGVATARQSFSLLVAVSASVSQDKPRQNAQEDWSEYPFPEFASFGHLEVQTLTSPTLDEFSRMLEAHRPHFVCFRGEQLPNKEIGSFRWGNDDLSSPKAMASLFGSVQPTMVYLETSYDEEVAEAIHSKGVPFVIFWKNSFSCYAASHFSHALFSVFQSSSSHPWDAFKLSEASFRLYCVRSNVVSPSNSQTEGGKQGPYLLGDPPIIDIVMPDIEAGDDEDADEADISAVKIHDEEGSVRFLLCGGPCALDDCLLGSLQDGLNALLNIELRGSKLHNRLSAPPPLLEAATFSRGVVTMKCDISTCSSAHISLLVSGSAQSCFDYQLLENHIKKEIIERCQLASTDCITDENNAHIPWPRTSASIACGAPIFEVCLRVPVWAIQVLRQLAPETSYRNLVALGIASVQGLSVASFSEDDAKRLLFFSRQRMNSKLPNVAADDSIPTPSWLRPPAPCCRRKEASQKMSPCSQSKHLNATKISTASTDCELQNSRCTNGFLLRTVPKRKTTKVAPMRPIPHTDIRKMMLFSGFGQLDGNREAGQVKTSLPFVLPAKPSMVGTIPAPYRKSSSNSHLAKQVMSLNPIPLKKHGCGRAPIHSCSEEEFVKDVMRFLILRGHTRLIPQGGLADFPDAILNSKRLDLYNLYREVVSRGGFHVGNGINWKGQVFSKMRNYTATNKMTGVGNTLKRHYETYLLEYELSHDDVDGECCLLCHSSAAGDWVNCGICGEWAHFGCDRRQGLGAFKDYAKTDGLEYICPQCSVSHFKKKLHKPSNGYRPFLFTRGVFYPFGGKVDRSDLLRRRKLLSNSKSLF